MKVSEWKARKLVTEFLEENELRYRYLSTPQNRQRLLIRIHGLEPFDVGKHWPKLRSLAIEHGFRVDLPFMGRLAVNEHYFS